jgi:hypothetical protein
MFVLKACGESLCCAGRTTVADKDNISGTARKAQQDAERVKAEIDRERARYSATHPEIDPALIEAGNGAERAATYAANTSEGGPEMLRLATEELIVALQQLSAAVHHAGGVIDRKLPDLPHSNTAGAVTVRGEAVAEDGRTFIAGPQFSEETPYFFPGGSVGGMVVPRGWYSHPWWRDLTRRKNTGKAGITLGLGAMAHEFYDKVIARMPDKPSTAQWEQGTGTNTTIGGRSRSGGSVDDDTWWDTLAEALGL